ncbi:MAG: mobile mystery protein B [Coriobacteriia bacterium]
MSTSGLFDEPEGATPVDPGDAEGLIPTWVATRADLNIAEQENIAKAIAWASSKNGPGGLASLMTDESMRNLHRRMFGDVWRWAGSYRQHDTNMGAHWPYIPTQVRDLLADVLVQTADPERLPWSPDELAVRFHHRLVAIHPFPNGNGRHSRLAADLLVAALGRPVFTWGAQDLSEKGAARSAYLEALRRADQHADFEPLVMFARS